METSISNTRIFFLVQQYHEMMSDNMQYIQEGILLLKQHFIQGIKTRELEEIEVELSSLYEQYTQNIYICLQIRQAYLTDNKIIMNQLNQIFSMIECSIFRAECDFIRLIKRISE